jgi:hypothetical protein
VKYKYSMKEHAHKATLVSGLKVLGEETICSRTREGEQLAEVLESRGIPKILFAHATSLSVLGVHHGLNETGEYLLIFILPLKHPLRKFDTRLVFCILKYMYSVVRASDMSTQVIYLGPHKLSQTLCACI